jgi:hypothetical protein
VKRTDGKLYLLSLELAFVRRVVVERSLYALGGYDGSNLDLVQKLSLESLTCELMQLRLPHAGFAFPFSSYMPPKCTWWITTPSTPSLP